MGLITETIDIKTNNGTYQYFEKLGYKIPKHYNEKKKKWAISTGETFTVNVKDLPKGSGIKIKCKCDNCNKTYELKYYQYAKHNFSKGFYCKNCSHKIILSGENHPNWNDNLTYEDRMIGRNYPAYKEFIKKVLIRDNYTCYRCGDNSHANKNVHHLDGYDWCIEKRTDETNAVCLCRQCHSNFHAYYGMGNNTKLQFQEWIGKDIKNFNKYDGKISPAREVICLEDKNVLKSCLEASRYYKCDEHQINFCCNRKNGYCSVKGLHFMWNDIYQNLSESEIEEYILSLKPKNQKSIICITTNKVFDNASIAANFYNMKRGNDKILKVCKGLRRSAGKESDTGLSLVWRFYNPMTKEIQDVI